MPTFNFGFVSYLLAGILFLLLTLLLLSSWRGKRQGILLVVASLVTSIWGFTAAFQALGSEISLNVIFFAEIARDAAWLIFLLGLLRSTRSTNLTRILRTISHALWIGVFVYGVVIVAGKRLGITQETVGGAWAPCCWRWRAWCWSSRSIVTPAKTNDRR